MTILPFFGKELQSSCFAQNMATEGLWDMADETGYYGVYRCIYCDKVFEGNNQSELELELDRHIDEEHSSEDDNDNDNNNEDSSDNDEEIVTPPSPEEGGSNNESYIKVIDINIAAEIAQMIGLDNADDFLYYYHLYNRFPLDPNCRNIVLLSDLIGFITYKYNARYVEIDNLSEIYYYDKFFMFSKYYKSGNYYYYRIYTKNYYTTPYEYIYVFY